MKAIRRPKLLGLEAELPLSTHRARPGGMHEIARPQSGANAQRVYDQNNDAAYSRLKRTTPANVSNAP